MFKTKTENHPPQILPSLEHHCSCILLFLSKAHLICSVWGASQGYADPTGHSDVLLFPEYLKSKAPWPFRLSSYTQQNKTFPLCLALNKSKLGICLLLQSSVGSQSSWGPELVCSYSDTSRWSSPRCILRALKTDTCCTFSNVNWLDHYKCLPFWIYMRLMHSIACISSNMQNKLE